MALTKKQVKQLRCLATKLNPLIQVGKNDLTAKEAGEELAERLGAELVQVIGNRFVLYRRSKRDDVEHIRLVRE